jgi:ketosteroid isomerase-like protein
MLREDSPMATSAAGAEEAARQIHQLDREFERNANAGNVQALVDGFYAEDARLLPPHAPQMNGKAGIAAFWQNVIAAGASGLRLETTEIQESGNLAYGIGRYTFTMAGAEQEGKYVVIYRRQDGRFLAVVDMFSPNA